MRIAKIETRGKNLRTLRLITIEFESTEFYSVFKSSEAREKLLTLIEQAVNNTVHRYVSRKARKA